MREIEKTVANNVEMANNVILRKLYGHAVIELLTEPQSCRVTVDKNFVPLLKVPRQKSSFKRDLKIFIETKSNVIFDMLYKKY